MERPAPSRADEIAANLATVHQRIRTAEAGAGRSPASVTLVAVSKMVPAEDVLAALATGQVDFGESYGQEFRDKRVQVDAGVAARGLPQPRWHFIGPLQTNKIKYVAGKVALIHSVDSMDGLAEIDRRLSAPDAGVQDVLIQVNVAGEVQKHGIVPKDLPLFLDRCAALGHIRCTGLMVIPPLEEDPEQARPRFAELRRLRDLHAQSNRERVALTHLSMGMSGDLEVAVAEGATLVRVGTAIFGSRS